MEEQNKIFTVIIFLLFIPLCTANSLIFYESFDNQSTINNNSCILCNITSFNLGIKGNAAYFSDSNYLTYPVEGNIDKNEGSVSFWVKPNNPSIKGGFFDYGEIGSSSSLGLFKPYTEAFYLEFRPDENYGGGQLSEVINSSNWNYLTAVWKTNALYANDNVSYFKLYLNGKYVSNRIYDPNSGANIFNFNPLENYFSVGRCGFYGIANSYIDELRIYDYARNTTEIMQDYKSYGACLVNSDCGSNGLIGNNFCLGDNVYKNYITYTCNNPGFNSSCSNTTSSQLVETCENGCITGLCTYPSIKNISSGPVKIIGRDLIVDGKNYTVKSLGYQPTPIGMNPEWGYDATIHPELRARDFPLIRAMNANTIRTWGKVGQMSFLDDAWNNGTKPIRVIMGYWMGNNYDYTDITVRNAIKSDFNSYVQTYKNHPAVLVWAIGNEENNFYGNGNNTKLAAYFSLVNEMAQDAYSIEGAAYHPVMAISLEFPNTMTTVGNAQGGADDSSIPYVDMWGINYYPGASFGNFFNTYETKTSKPLIVTEYGIDALNNSALAEYESTQASWEVNLWREIESSIAVGGSLMEYSDEYWKAGNVDSHDLGGYPTTSHPDFYSNEEWWGIMRVVKNNSGLDIMQPRQAYYALADEFFEEPDYNNINIPLNSGWNLISIPVNISNNSIENVFGGVMNRVIVINSFDNGALTYDPLLPDFSDLNKTDYLHGYWVKMNQSANLSVFGTAPENKTINLVTGWNLISYLCNSTKNVTEIFAPIMSKVIVINGFENGALTYDPLLPEFSDLQVMKPNLGYWVKMNQSATLNYICQQIENFSIIAPNGTINNSTPEISWETAIGATNYDLKISTYNDCSSPVQSANNLVNTSYTLSALANGTYFSCVTAKDSVGNMKNATNNGMMFVVNTVPNYYHQVFVSAEQVSPTSSQTIPPPNPNVFGSQNAADWICTFKAYNAGYIQDWNGLDLIYKAILSQNGNNARDRIQINGPVYNMNGDLVANNVSQFWSSNHLAGMNYDEYGRLITGSQLAWTGSYSNGQWNIDSCGNWNISTHTRAAIVGNAPYSNSIWANYGLIACDSTARLYCVSPAMNQ